MKVKKRDGTLQEYDANKIINAVNSAGGDGIIIEGRCHIHDGITVEEIQDEVEKHLIIYDHAAGQRYIVYRNERAQVRNFRPYPDSKALPEYIHRAKYAKHIRGRRETWEETVDRCLSMYDRDDKLFDMVLSKRVLPSMRSLQFGGQAILEHNARMYNCSFTHINRPRAFSETFYLLLCGCGVGFSVQEHHVNKLFVIKKPSRHVTHIPIPDSIEGWSEAVYNIFYSYSGMDTIEFDYSNIRPEGAPLQSGGKAPGHLPLRDLIEILRNKLDHAIGRRLRPIECYDIICHIAEAVLSGGIRRSSLISLFSKEDDEMLSCKTPEHFQHGGLNSQRAMSNNSVVLLRKCERVDFNKVMQDNPYGEPGFFFTHSYENGCNPCGEILLIPKERGFAFCNLTEINGSLVKKKLDFMEAIYYATLLGTLQCQFTDFKYLHQDSQDCAERDALLGVSITGIMDSPDILLDPHILKEGREYAIKCNKIFASTLGINPAKRVTTVKPSGTASLLLGCAPGIHPHHARRYFRRVTANKHESLARFFQKINPHMVEVKPDGDLCITFPVEVPYSAKTVKDMDEIEFMNHVFTVYDNWIDGHNVSCTVTYDNFEKVMDHVWDNRNRINAMAFLPKSSDKNIPFMPREEVCPEDEAKWNSLIVNYVDYTKFNEEDDRSYDSACEGRTCGT